MAVISSTAFSFVTLSLMLTDEQRELKEMERDGMSWTEAYCMMWCCTFPTTTHLLLEKVGEVSTRTGGDMKTKQKITMKPSDHPLRTFKLAQRVNDKASGLCSFLTLQLLYCFSFSEHSCNVIIKVVNMYILPTSSSLVPPCRARLETLWRRKSLYKTNGRTFGLKT